MNDYKAKIEAIVLRHEERVMANYPGEPLKKGELSFAEQATASLLQLITEARIEELGHVVDKGHIIDSDGILTTIATHIQYLRGKLKAKDKPNG